MRCEDLINLIEAVRGGTCQGHTLSLEGESVGEQPGVAQQHFEFCELVNWKQPASKTLTKVEEQFNFSCCRRFPVRSF